MASAAPEVRYQIGYFPRNLRGNFCSRAGPPARHQHPNILTWERNGRVAKTEFLLPMARILGVTVEEVLGEARPRRVANPGGRLGQVFEAAAKLPRSKQDKVIALLEAFVDQHAAASWPLFPSVAGGQPIPPGQNGAGRVSG